MDTLFSTLADGLNDGADGLLRSMGLSTVNAQPPPPTGRMGSKNPDIQALEEETLRLEQAKSRRQARIARRKNPIAELKADRDIAKETPPQRASPAFVFALATGALFLAARSTA